MKYLYVSDHPLLGHTPPDRQIDKLPDNATIWMTGLSPPERFVLESYGFDEYIFFVGYDDIDRLDQWDLYGNRCHIIVAHCTDKSSALYFLETDMALNIHVYFCDDPLAQFGKFRKFEV